MEDDEDFLLIVPPPPEPDPLFVGDGILDLGSVLLLLLLKTTIEVITKVIKNYRNRFYGQVGS